MTPSDAPTNAAGDVEVGFSKLRCGEIFLRVFVLVLVLRLLISGALSGMVDTTLPRIDFNQLYYGADRLNHEMPLYRYKVGEVFPPDIYIYPPLPAMILRPLARLHYPRAVQLWFYINLGCLLAGVAIYARSARHQWHETAAIVLMLVTAFRFWPTTMNFGLGQINCVIFAIVATMYWAVGRNKLWILAAAIAAGVLVKTWVIGFAIYFVLKRAWRAGAACIAMFGVAMLLCFASIGWSQIPEFLHLSAAYGIQPAMRSESIIGVAMLHFASSHVRIQENLLASNWLDNAWVFWGFIAAGYGIVLLGLTSLFRRGGADSPTRRLLEFGIVVSSVLLLMPLCQIEYFLFCLPLLWTLLIPGKSQKDRVPLVAMILAAVVYLLWTRNNDWLARSDSGHAAGPRSLLLSTAFIASAVLWATAMSVWHKVAREERDPPATG